MVSGRVGIDNAIDAGRYGIYTYPTNSLNFYGLKMDIKEYIHEQVNAHPVVLFMKGTPQFPQCGFSATVVQILKQAGVTQVAAMNVLESDELRQGIKEYANWPTIPQLYIKGEFVGGCDIVKEMFASGELQQMLAEVNTSQA